MTLPELKRKSNQTQKNVSYIVEKGMCVGCGACYSACESNSINLQLESVFVPKVTENCKNCGLCVDVCPLKNLILSSKHLLGERVSNYIGFAVEQNIRNMGSSGGVVTAILCFAMDEGLIEGAVVAKSLSKNLYSCVTIARNTQEIKEAQGSKYFPVPMLKAIKDILRSQGRFAFVGLPCHLIALKNLESLYPSLKERIVLKLGLFCGRGIDSNGVNYILQDHKIAFGEVNSLNFRGNGWPGKMKINYLFEGNCKDLLLSHKEYAKILFPSYFFMPTSCLFCTEYSAEKADISFGDPWGLGLHDESGTSIIISRTSKGQELLKSANEKEYIVRKQIPISLTVYSHFDQIFFHKIGIAHRKILSRFFNLPYQQMTDDYTFDFNSFLLAAIILANNSIYNKLLRANLWYIIPPQLLRLIGLITSFMKLLCSKKQLNNWKTANFDLPII